MRLLEYIEELESRGQCWFFKNEALTAMGCSNIALNDSIKRLSDKNRILTIKSGFLIIVPLTYKTRGVIPADWFVNPLMEYLNIPYYVGLLSAANFYGAAHQKPQLFQVMIDKDLRPITKDSLRIYFYKNSSIKAALTREIQVSTGYITVSSPEVTAIDLVTYHRVCGYMSNVATVLSELQEIIDPAQLYKLAVSNIYDFASLQRLGYLLSLPDVGGANIVDKLKILIQNNKPRFVPLQPGQTIANALKDHTWRVFINEEIEVDQ